MDSTPTLDQKLLEVLSYICVEKEDEKEYLSSLKEMLDVYLLSVMEEENPVFSLLHQRDHYPSTSFENIKTISPNYFRLNLPFTLPILPNHLEILYTTPGFVELKLSQNLEEHLQYSKIWREACYKGVQKSLMRHLSLWKDNDDFLLCSSFNKWLCDVVDKALHLTGSIPDFQIRRLTRPHEVVLEIKDCQSNRTLSLLLVPVISFPSALLPEKILENVPDSICCDEWLVECRSFCGADRLWGMSLWQHEREIIARNPSVKNIIRLIKALRIDSKWQNLKNDHIKTHVMLELLERPSDFGESRPATLLENLLLKLRERLVCQAGIPLIWDRSHNVLCGLTGPQKAELAFLVTKVWKELRRCDGNPSFEILHLFRKDLSNVPPSESGQSTPTSSSASSSDTEPVLTARSGPTTSSSQNHAHTSGRSPHSSSSASSSSQPSSYQFVHQRAGSGQGHQNMAQEHGSGTGWMWAAGAAVLGAVAIVGTVLSNKNKSNK